jgi:hypothetical protein
MNTRVQIDDLVIEQLLRPLSQARRMLRDLDDPIQRNCCRRSTGC